MQARPISYSAEECLADVAFSVAHLQADAVGSQFVAEAEAAYAALQAKRTESVAQERAVAGAQAGLISAKVALSDAVRTARQRLLEDVRHQRHSRKMLMYFPHGLSALIHAPYLDEVNAVRVLAGNMAIDPSQAVQALSAPLMAAADAAQAAFDARQQALVAEATAFGHLQIEKVNAGDTLRRIAHRLLELLGNDRDRVNSFFRPIGHPSHANEASGSGAETTPEADAPEDETEDTNTPESPEETPAS